MKEVIEKFRSECGLDTESMEALIANMTEVEFRKGDVVIECGAMDDSIYIIKTGIWRSCIDRDGSELTLWFSGDSSFVVNVWCYQRRETSRIPLNKLASYLRLTTQSLSRIRASIRQGSSD